ncbi:MULTISPECIES: iron donor protein CyaY [unclassified Gilliamella]|uniref:iron donor protein CyaY n=1 Tax=unclassified Gilliamella TaxID=2685620 RepID=UPI00130A5BC9|nr:MULTISPECIES: iron donor protein CyaY [unclassified Gilliamella]MWP49369.1 iron donor protein CyaY [Gilliamella sp. Lep-s35]MWP68993.1 iron donor protein CyaY [Gilliamella sp. Lep-s5]MWP77360.1 iron donor protein CyaY [Gilliamella sp. Lep-s21]
MNITQFHTLTEQLFDRIELFLDNYADEHDIDLDYETTGNVITISFPNNSKIIVNTQEPLFQIWLATRKQGYHFDYVNDNWFCNRTNQSFDIIFSESVTDQANQ